MITPQMNANERKYILGVFPMYCGARYLFWTSRASFAKNNNNDLRSFAFICGK